MSDLYATWNRKPAAVWPVMLTPFTESLEIDWPAFDALVEWYIEAGVDGLFAVCLSSEMYALTPEERLALARRAVTRAAGRVPVIATGTFGGSVQSQSAFVREIAETGVDAVVLTASEVAPKEADEDEWLRNMQEFVSLTGEIPLGLYECPAPYHRLMSPRLVRAAAETGRFHVMKDTSCRRDDIRQKVSAVEGTPLRWLNANAPTLLYSLECGGGGFMGIGANVLPRVFVRLCKAFRESDGKAERIQAFLSVADMAVRNKYTTSAKLFLAGQGLPILPVCRRGTQTLSDEELVVVEHLAMAAGDLLESIGA